VNGRERHETAETARARLLAHPWPAALRGVLGRIADGGHQAWLVGGTVRDALLGREAHGTFDVATDLDPEAVRGRFAHVKPVGIAHGTVLVIEDDVKVECTTFRREGPYPDARRPAHVEFTGDLAEDLARRDLTVNAMAWDPRAGTFADPIGGLADLAAGVLRAVGDPAARFHEDGLRPLRVARFAATLEMTPEPETRAALGSALDRARMVAAERVREELSRMMAARRPSVGFELMREAGLLALWLPELDRCHGVPQNRFHAHDVYAHSLLACDGVAADRPVVRWAALLHDIGKPDTRVERKGDGTFWGHDAAGATLAGGLLDRLRFPLEMRDAIVHLIAEHMFDYRPEWTDAAVRRWLRRVGPEAVDDLLALREADARATSPGREAALDGLRVRIEAVRARADALTVRDLAVDGADVMRSLGIGEGRVVGEVLEALLEEVLEHPERNVRETLLARLRARAAERTA